MDGTRASRIPSLAPPAHPAPLSGPGMPALTHAAAAEPLLRPERFDPPPPDAPAASRTHALDHVLDDVEHVADGIDALLRSASDSGLGPELHDADPANPRASKVTAIANDEDMLRVFDDQHATDLKTIDRILAQQAAQAALDGEFESIDSGSAEAGMHEIEAVIAVRPAMATSAAAPPPASPTTLSRAEAAEASMLPPFPPILLATPLSPVGTVPAAADPQRVGTSIDTTIEGGAGASVFASSAVMPADTDRVPASDVPPNPATPVMPPMISAAQVSEPNAAREMSSGGQRQPGRWLAFPVRLLAGPMQVVPASFRPIVNAFALSLALWSPAVWFGAPRLADYRRARTHAAQSPAHGQSALTGEPGNSHSDNEANGHAAKPKQRTTAKASAGH